GGERTDPRDAVRADAVPRRPRSPDAVAEPARLHARARAWGCGGAGDACAARSGCARPRWAEGAERPARPRRRRRLPRPDRPTPAYRAPAARPRVPDRRRRVRGPAPGNERPWRGGGHGAAGRVARAEQSFFGPATAGKLRRRSNRRRAGNAGEPPPRRRRSDVPVEEPPE